MLYRKQWVDINSIAKLGKDLFIKFNTLICCYKRLGDSSIHMMQFVGVMYMYLDVSAKIVHDPQIEETLYSKDIEAFFAKR